MSLEKVAGAWFWNTYGEAIIGKAIGAVKAQWEQFNWGQAAETYRQRIKERYGVMRVLGMSRPVPLEDIFTDVFILDKPTAFRRYAIEQLKQDPSQLDKGRVSGLRIVSKENRLFVLGKPGAGKTTFLSTPFR
jgi:predicted NACHT family NTPase